MQKPNSQAIPDTMLALRLTGVGMEKVVLEEIEVPRPEADQVLCRVECAAACASDNKIIDQGGEHSLMSGWDVAKWPTILGHEGCVTAVEVGEKWADRIQVGARYALQPAIPSGPTRYRERYNDNARDVSKIAIGYTLPGLFAEYVLIDPEVIETACMVPLPDEGLPYYAAALSEPISCVVAAQQHSVHVVKDAPDAPRRAELGLLRGGTTLILGAGPMGLLHIEIAMTHAPNSIIVSEPMDERRKTAEEFFGGRVEEAGTELILTVPEELEGVIAEATEGRGVDDCIVALGIQAVQQKSFDYLAKGGVTNLFGGLKAGESTIELDARRIHYDSVSAVGSSGSDPSDIGEALEMVAAGKIEPGKYVAAVGGLDAARDLIQAVRGQELDGKGIIYPSLRKPLEQVEAWSVERETRLLR